jgi:hypothetical protein
MPGPGTGPRPGGSETRVVAPHVLLLSGLAVTLTLDDEHMNKFLKCECNQ